MTAAISSTPAVESHCARALLPCGAPGAGRLAARKAPIIISQKRPSGL